MYANQLRNAIVNYYENYKINGYTSLKLDIRNKKGCNYSNVSELSTAAGGR